MSRGTWCHSDAALYLSVRTLRFLDGVADAAAAGAAAALADEDACSCCSLFFGFEGVINEAAAALELELLVGAAAAAAVMSVSLSYASSLSAARVLDAAAATEDVDALVDAPRLGVPALGAAGARPAASPLGGLAVLLLVLGFLDILTVARAASG